MSKFMFLNFPNMSKLHLERFQFLKFISFLELQAELKKRYRLCMINCSILLPVRIQLTHMQEYAAVILNELLLHVYVQQYRNTFG